jgi:hypothetical protein
LTQQVSDFFADPAPRLAAAAVAEASETRGGLSVAAGHWFYLFIDLFIYTLGIMCHVLIYAIFLDILFAYIWLALFIYP